MDRRRPITILLLEGRPHCRAEYAEGLRETGLEVTAVGDSQAAFAAVGTIRAKAIVANIDPEIRNDRLNFCRQIKGDPRTKAIPILLTIESLMEQDVELATDPGVLVLTMAPNAERSVRSRTFGATAASNRTNH